MTDCHSVLLRQIKRIGLSEKQPPDSRDQWQKFLQRVSKTYQQADRDRYTLERSLDLSSREMRNLYDQLKLSSRSELGRERALLWQVMHLLPDIIYFKALDDSYMGCNEAFCHYAGKPEADIIGAYDEQLFSKKFARHLLEVDRDVITHGQTLNTEESWRDPQQHERIFEFYRTPLHDDHDELLGILAIGHDISERKANEEALRRSAIVFESTTDGVVISDARGRVEAVNRAFTRIMGYSQQEARGKDPFLLDSGRHEADFYKAIKQALMREGNWQGELWTRNKDGGLVPTWASISQVKNTTGQIGNYVTVFSDISHIKESQRKLEHLANHDPLTGLPNRMLFIDRLQTALHAAERDAQKVAVLFMDLDRL
ncbi:MAG: PAS domain S-box protein [gamma proteobacterium symbiont of Bathyaustriella thionipta]|nr:PAS domain S-box protein [gamma proteobacterium symbiont of Bathyaustriella thionipta]